MHASHPPRFKIVSVTKASTSSAVQEAAALRRFVSRVGGIENGRKALALLTALSPAMEEDLRKAA